MDANTTLPLHTGRAMPALGLGTWQLTSETAGTIAAALALGYRLVDTAADYGTHSGIGEGLERSGLDRAELFLVAKIEEDDDPLDATRRYLREIGVTYADLMLIHRPPPSGAGEALWEGLIEARREGLVRDIGVSNYPAELIDTLVDATGEVPAVNQIEWSPFGHGDAMLRYAQEKGMVIQAYSPLTRATRLDDGTLREIGSRHGKSPAQVLLRWNLQRGTAPIPKANRREHLEENIDVFDFELSAEDMAALDGRNERYSSLGTLPYR